VYKPLLTVYVESMTLYPLSVLMLVGIKEILIILIPEDLPRFKKKYVGFWRRFMDSITL